MRIARWLALMVLVLGVAAPAWSANWAKCVAVKVRTGPGHTNGVQATLDHSVPWSATLYGIGSDGQTVSASPNSVTMIHVLAESICLDSKTPCTRGAPVDMGTLCPTTERGGGGSPGQSTDSGTYGSGNVPCGRMLRGNGPIGGVRFEPGSGNTCALKCIGGPNAGTSCAADSACPAGTCDCYVGVLFCGGAPTQ